MDISKIRHQLAYLNISFCISQDEYAARGVRWVYRGEPGSPNRLSEELEPEYVTLSKDETKAYVGLQVRG